MDLLYLEQHTLQVSVEATSIVFCIYIQNPFISFMSKQNQPPFCIIFDIDETMIQYLHTETNIGRWRSYKKLFPGKIDAHESKSHIVLFRPGLNDFIRFAKAHNIDIAIWTYGNKTYSQFIDEEITKYAGLEKSPFVFVYSREEIELDLVNGREEKDLRRVYDAYPGKYNRTNTFLVDNRAANIFHNFNRENGILVESFDIMAGYSPNRDTMFRTIQTICGKLMKDFSKHDYSIFSKSNIVRNGLGNLYKKYLVSGTPISLLSEGRVDEDLTFRRVINAKQTRKRVRGVGLSHGVRKTRRKKH